MTAPVYADLTPVDAVLVLDVSRSMRTADPDRISRDAMNLFIEKLTENRDRAGVVAYAGNVENSLTLHIINDENRGTIKNFIDGLEYASWTDHGLGLIEAIDIITNDFDEARQGIIIFLTDGNMNVNPAGTRTNENAQEDVYRAIAIARGLNIPIHTIGLNFDGNLALEYIENIAEATGGLSFETACAQDIPEIIGSFFTLMVAAPPVIEPPAETPLPSPLPSPSPSPLPPPLPQIEEITDSPKTRPEIIPITAALLGIAAVIIKKSLPPKRVFTGKLEVTKNKTTHSFNLIEYGNRVTLSALLKDGSRPEFDTVIFSPSPNAPSYLPQLLIKCKNPDVKFIKDFIGQDISKGIPLETGAEGLIQSEETQVFIRYSP
jgi:hypothetical protein